MELERGLDDGVLAQQAGVAEPGDVLHEHGEGRVGGVADGLPRGQVGDVALDADRVQRGALGGQAAEHESDLDQVGGRVVGRRQRIESGTQEVEGVHSERGDQPVLGAEQAVDGARGRTDLLCDAAYRERLDATGRHRALGRGQQRGGGALVVLPGAPHVTCAR